MAHVEGATKGGTWVLRSTWRSRVATRKTRRLRRGGKTRTALRCEAVFADHLRPLHANLFPDPLPRSILFAVDDSDASEEGAHFTLKRVARPGDSVHFVHVITDSRAPCVSVGGVTEETENVFYSSSVDVAEAFPLAERRQLLETQGEQMMKRRLVKNIEQHEDVHTKYHLPILTRPESAAEISSVMSDLANKLKVDIFSIVSPSSGVFLECGSVGFHCYEQSKVPVLLLPSDPEQLLLGTEDKVVLVLVNSESERRTATDWIRRHLGHVFEPYGKRHDRFRMAMRSFVYRLELFIACMDNKCTIQVPQMTKDMAKQLERTSTKLQPACVVMYASEEMTILDQLQQHPFVADYVDANRYPIVVLPKGHGESPEHKTYWSDYTYSEDEILQT